MIGSHQLFVYPRKTHIHIYGDFKVNMNQSLLNITYPETCLPFYVSIVNLSNTYQQVVVDEQSQQYLTISMHSQGTVNI